MIDDATQSDAKCSEAQRGPLWAVVEAVVVVPMECGLHAQRAGQRIDRMEPVRMTAGRLVGDQEVGALGSDQSRSIRKKPLSGGSDTDAQWDCPCCVGRWMRSAVSVVNIVIPRVGQ